jgi:serine/threonine protein kinase
MAVIASIPETNIGQLESSPKNANQDFRSLLSQFGADYSFEEQYLVVGPIPKCQGWILHIPVIRPSLVELLNLVVPELLRLEIAFKIVRDMYAAIDILEGITGYAKLGKLICIYPADDLKAVMLATKLIELTRAFEGPSIPTDYHLGALIYTRYGSFTPLSQKSSNDSSAKFINDAIDNLIPDTYTIPFSMPAGVEWPFDRISKLVTQKSKTLLNAKYYPISHLKYDAKGNVIKALFFKHFYLIKQCVIKQARRSMCVDSAGRGVQEKLKWQYELYKRLKQSILMPEVYEYFEENGDAYLAMEYIRGISLQNWILAKYRSRIWEDLTTKEQLEILNCLMLVFKLIESLHICGYVHRDITPENFLIDRNNNVFIIDMELTWSATELTPNPPFELGTYGFMSPEQLRCETPTRNDDIYSLGCFMLIFFCNLLPAKLPSNNHQGLKKLIMKIVGESKICDLICKCLNTTPTARPSLSDLMTSVQEYHTKLHNRVRTPTTSAKNDSQSVEAILPIIQAGINRLASSPFSDKNGLWHSKSQKLGEKLPMDYLGATIQKGWHTGIAGPLWLLARAKRVGFDISMCHNCYKANLKYLKRKYSPTKNTNPGLFIGTAGSAISIAEGLDSQLIEFDEQVNDIMKEALCPDNTDGFDLSEGQAGVGIAVLRCLRFLDPSFAKDLLLKITLRLSRLTKSKLFWRQNQSTNLYTGPLGIVWFFLAALERYPNPFLEETVFDTLQLVLPEASKMSSNYRRNKYLTATHATQGALLCLVRAYKLLKIEKYREIVEANLHALPPHPISYDFTLNSGLTGLGEILLEAAGVFDNEHWKQKANWIAELLGYSFQEDPSKCGFWLVNEKDIGTADLFQGVSGVLHFLMRSRFADQLSHPLWPYHK